MGVDATGETTSPDSTVETASSDSTGETASSNSIQDDARGPAPAPALRKLTHSITPTTPSLTIHNSLMLLKEYCSSSSPFIHPYMVSFPDGQRRASWAQYWPEMRQRNTIHDFWIYPKNGKQACIALLCSPPGTWVGVGNNHAWVVEPWHCCAVLILNKTNRRHNPGKMMIVWDPDPHVNRTSCRVRATLRGLQFLLYKFIRNRHSKSVEVWYSWDTTCAGKGQCLKRSLEKIIEWGASDDMCWQGPSDPRTQGYEHIRHS